MNIDQMPAGRTMDFMIAEKILGMTCECPHGPASMCRVHDCALYSQDIQAAWVVVEKLKATSSRGYVLEFLRGEWTVGIRACGDAGEPELYDHDAGSAEEAPLAICRAALKSGL